MLEFWTLMLEAVTKFTNSPCTRRRALSLIGATFISACSRSPQADAGSPSEVSSKWSPLHAQIQSKMEKLGNEITEYFLKNNPEFKSLVEGINKGQVSFATYVSEMFVMALNSSTPLNDPFFFQKSFLEGPSVLNSGTTLTREFLAEVKKVVENPSIPLLFLKVMNAGSLFVGYGKTLNKFDEMALDYLALRNGIKALEYISASKKPPQVSLRNLSYYSRPISGCSSPNYAYMDLASGNNLDEYLPDILESPLARPLVLVDISPYIAHYWKSVSAALNLSNISVLNLDVRKISKDTVKEKIGTIRLQNVGAWIPNLDSEWVKKLTDLLEPGGQIVIVQPLVYLFKSEQRRQLDRAYFSQVVGQDPFNIDLISRFENHVAANPNSFSLHFGHVNSSGQLVEGVSGFIQRPTEAGRIGEIFENVIVVKKK